MDYFTIVSTKERRGIYFTLVPHKWVKNKTLFWPQHLRHTEREELRSNPSSEPDDSWVKFTCIMKLTKIKSFQEGLELEKQLIECTDTEAEEELFNKVKPTTSTDCGTIQNRNYMLIEKKKLDTEIRQPSVNFEVVGNTSVDECNNIASEIERDSSTATILFVDKPINESNVSCENANILIENQEFTSFKEEVKEELEKTRKELREDMAKIMTFLDEIYKKVVNISTVNKSENIKESDYCEELFNKFPLSTTEEIEAVDAQIRKDEKYKSQMITFLSKIGGESGQEDGTKIAYKVIDHIVTPQVLLKYSWTGVSRGKKLEKLCFQNLQGILDVMFHVILKADNRHTRQKNANIFKNGILKHAKKRSLRKRPLLLSTEEKRDESEEILQDVEDMDEVRDQVMDEENTSANL